MGFAAVIINIVYSKFVLLTILGEENVIQFQAGSRRKGFHTY